MILMIPFIPNSKFQIPRFNLGIIEIWNHWNLEFGILESLEFEIPEIIYAKISTISSIVGLMR